MYRLLINFMSSNFHFWIQCLLGKKIITICTEFNNWLKFHYVYRLPNENARKIDVVTYSREAQYL